MSSFSSAGAGAAAAHFTRKNRIPTETTASRMPGLMDVSCKVLSRNNVVKNTRTRCDGLFGEQDLAPVLRFHLQLEDFIVHQPGCLVVPVGAEEGVVAGGRAVGGPEIAGELHP